MGIAKVDGVGSASNTMRGEKQPLRSPSLGSAIKGAPKLRKLLPNIWALVSPRKYLLLLGLLLIAINRVSSLVLPATTKYLIDDVFVKGNEHLLGTIVLVVLGATAVQAITSFSLAQTLSKAAWQLITDLRIAVQAHIGRLPVSYYDANRTGALVSRIMSDVEGIRNLVGTGLIEFIGGLLTALLVFIKLVRMSPEMTWFCFAILFVFALALRRVFAFLRPIYRERAVIYADVTGRLTESLGGVRVVKAYRAESRESEVFSTAVRRLFVNIMKSLTATSFMSLLSTMVVGSVAALVMFMGAREHLHGTLSVGNYVEYTVFLAYLIAPVYQVVSIGTQLTEAVAGFERTLEVLSEVEEDSDPRRTFQFASGAVAGEVRFEEVCFAYAADKPVLHSISFSAQPGSVTALVGSSGSGKSTIISLICAFHNPGSGAILVDGVDLTTVSLESYRSQLGVVLQEAFLFDGSIRDNIAFSRPHATEEEILEAGRIARVDEFTARFPDGYAAIVGERGVKLSGGQRQRLSIARAILADPRILILDEATSSLDSESESLIQEGLSYLMQGRTTFVIAHRLSTIRSADQILVIENGQIAERGMHEELIEARGRYYDLYMRQSRLESNLFLAPGEGGPAAQPSIAIGDIGDAPDEPTFSGALHGLR
jgi:ABC-type multidrug transport system fused ATPase/permease subunit